MTNSITANGDDHPFKTTTKRDDDKVKVEVEDGNAIFSVQSSFDQTKGTGVISR